MFGVGVTKSTHRNVCVKNTLRPAPPFFPPLYPRRFFFPFLPPFFPPPLPPPTAPTFAAASAASAAPAAALASTANRAHSVLCPAFQVRLVARLLRRQRRLPHALVLQHTVAL